MSPEDIRNRAHSITKRLIDNGELPRFVFKYYSADEDLASIENRYTELIISNQEIRFANPKTFNDPFDGQLIPDIRNTIEELEKYFLSYFEKFHRRISPTATPDEITAKAIPDAKERALLKYNQDEQSKVDFEKSFIEALFCNYKVSCFSENLDNILLWSYYAKNHTGLCLKFDLLADLDFFLGMYKVNYKKRHPKFNIIRTQLDGIIETLLCTKAKFWKHEQEWRLIKASPTITDENGKLVTSNYESFKFNKSALAEVIFGCNASDIFIERIKQAALIAGMDNLVFKKARVSQTEFILVFDIV